MEVLHMPKTQQSFGKYLIGMVVSLIIFLAGGWLILAPFALGYQLYGTDWVSQTTNNFVVGICVAIVALVACALFSASLFRALGAAGVLAARKQPEQAPAPFQPQSSVALVPATTQNDLDRTLSTLAAALAADLNSRREAGSDQAGDQLFEQSVTRREA
jgi:hypothetical protein